VCCLFGGQIEVWQNGMDLYAWGAITEISKHSTVMWSHVSCGQVTHLRKA
jgi:hypothetical protein